MRRFFDYCCGLTHIRPQIFMASSYSVDYVNSMTHDAGITTLTSAMAFQITNPQVCIRRLLLPVTGDIYICAASQAAGGAHLKKSFISFSAEYFQKNPRKDYMADGSPA